MSMRTTESKRPLYAFSTLVILLVLLLAIPSGYEQNAYTTAEEPFDTEATFSGYAGDPEHGSQPSAVSINIPTRTGTTEQGFSLTWSNDEPDSEAPEFTLTINGIVDDETFLQTKTSTTSPINILARGKNMDGDWSAEIILESAGSKPVGPLGLASALSEPKEGNSWSLSVTMQGTTRLDENAAPDFSLTDVNGRTFRLREHLGKVVIIDLNSVSCPLCAEQIEELKNIHAKYSEEVVVITVVTSELSDQEIINFRDGTGATWTFAKDTDRVVEKYQLTSTRKLVILDPEGRGVYSNSRVVPEKTLTREIESALQGESSPISFGDIGILGLAFLIGVSAFFAPCALPLLPAYISRLHLNGAKRTKHKKNGKKDKIENSISVGASMALGSGIYYVFLGALVSMIGAVTAVFLPAFGMIMAVVLIVVGVTIALGRPPMLAVASYRIKKRTGLENVSLEKPFKAISGAMVGEEHSQHVIMGAGYGMASSVCHGVMLVTVILLASSRNWLIGLKAGMLFALGMSLAMFTAFATIDGLSSPIFKKMQEKVQLINRISGALLVIAGAALIYFTL